MVSDGPRGEKEAPASRVLSLSRHGTRGAPSSSRRAADRLAGLRALRPLRHRPLRLADLPLALAAGDRAGAARDPHGGREAGAARSPAGPSARARTSTRPWPSSGRPRPTSTRSCASASIVREVEIRDKNGVLVYEGAAARRGCRRPGAGAPAIAPPIGSPELPRHVEPPHVETRSSESDRSRCPTSRCRSATTGMLADRHQRRRARPADRGAAQRPDPPGGAGAASRRCCCWSRPTSPSGCCCGGRTRLELQAAEAERLAYSAPSPPGWRTRSAIRSTRSTSTCRCWRRSSTSTARPPPASGCWRSPARSSAGWSGW